MAFVLDASTALAWCFEDETTPATEKVLDMLIDDSAVVPQLWELEVANALLTAERRGRITESQSTRFVALLGALPIRLEVGGSDMSQLLQAGRRHNLSAYDTAYLLLAEREGLKLATVDDALMQAARNVGVPLLPG